MGNCAVPQNIQFSFSCSFFTTVIWSPLGCMGPLSVCGALKDIWGPLGCMGPLSVYGALKGVWGPLGCMGPLRVYGAL